MSQCREEFNKNKVVDKKWFIRIGCLWGLQAGGQEMPWPKNLLGYSFIIKAKWRGGKVLLCLSWVDVMLPSSAPPPGWPGEFSCPSMVKVGPHIIVFHVCREHVVGSINLLSSLDRMCVSCHHCFPVLGYLPCFCFMGLLPSKPAWFHG